MSATHQVCCTVLWILCSRAGKLNVQWSQKLDLKFRGNIDYKWKDSGFAQSGKKYKTSPYYANNLGSTVQKKNMNNICNRL